MATLEVGYCTPAEYGTENTKGLGEKHLYLGKLYIGMFALRSDDPSRRTAKEVCQVTDYDSWGDNVSHVGLKILDADFQVMSEGWAVFEDRFAKTTGGLVIDGIPVRACYLRAGYLGYTDSVMQGFMRGLANREIE